MLPIFEIYFISLEDYHEFKHLSVTISQNRGIMEIPINIHKYCKPTSIHEIILRIYWAQLGRGD